MKMYQMINSLMISSLTNKHHLVFFNCYNFIIYIYYNGDIMNLLIDIREPYEYRMGHIPNSKNISKDLLELVPEKYLNKSTKYILYCDTGPIAHKLSIELNKIGYNTTYLKGGYSEWLKSNHNL